MKNLWLLSSTLFIKTYPSFLVASTCGKRSALEFLNSIRLLDLGECLGPIQTILEYCCCKTTGISTGVSENKNPWDAFYKTKSSTIHANLGCIVEQNKNITEVNTPKDMHIY